MKYISQLSDTELNRHLRVFLKHISLHVSALNIELDRIDAFGKQYQAFSWAVETEEKLLVYSRDINLLIRKLRNPTSDQISTLYFLDLPRPPVFIAQGDIHTTFRKLVTDIKASSNYSQRIERDLGIGELYR